MQCRKKLDYDMSLEELLLDYLTYKKEKTAAAYKSLASKTRTSDSAADSFIEDEYYFIKGSGEKKPQTRQNVFPMPLQNGYQYQNQTPQTFPAPMPQNQTEPSPLIAPQPMPQNQNGPAPQAAPQTFPAPIPGTTPPFPQNLDDLFTPGVNPETDMEFMKLLYGEIAKRLMPYVTETLGEYEYEGSPIYGDFPDKETIAQIVDKVLDRATEIDEIEDISSDVERENWGQYHLLKSVAELLVLFEIFLIKRRAKQSASLY